MNLDELIRKARLTDKEIERLRNEYAKKAKWGESFIDWANEAQLRKAIPAVFEAIENVAAVGYEGLFISRENWQALKGEGDER